MQRRRLTSTPMSEVDHGKAERLARQARMAAKQKTQEVGAASVSSGGGRKSGSMLPLAAFVGVVGGVIFAVVEIRSHPDGALGQMYKDSWLETTLNNMRSDLDAVYMPASDALLMPYEAGPTYGEVPPGTPPPPLLVIDLEKTLIGSEYDAKYGWRHIKRPGLQRFLARMTQYYEVVIVSENEIGEVQLSIDPENQCHKHGPSTLEMRKEVMLKRLDLMNRDLARIILIDDSAEASSLFPRNTLLVKPFDDVHDTHDTTLDDLTLLLSAFVHEGIYDFRESLDRLGTHEAEEAVIEYKMRVAAAKDRERQKRERGLGLLLKGATRGDKASDSELLDEAAGSVLSKIVGAAPEDFAGGLSPGAKDKGALTAALATGAKGVIAPADARKESVKKKGSIFQWLEDSEAEKVRWVGRPNNSLHLFSPSLSIYISIALSLYISMYLSIYVFLSQVVVASFLKGQSLTIADHSVLSSFLVPVLLRHACSSSRCST